METIPIIAYVTPPASRHIVVKCGDAISEGLLYFRNVAPRERRIRAAKIWGWMWLCALLSVPVCGLHIVLVPAFLIAGPITAYLRYRRSEVPDRASGSCPSCNKDLDLALKSSDRLPKRVYCPACNATLYLLEKDDSSMC